MRLKLKAQHHFNGLRDPPATGYIDSDPSDVFARQLLGVFTDGGVFEGGARSIALQTAS